MVRAIRLCLPLLLLTMAGTSMLAQGIVLRNWELCQGETVNLGELVTGTAESFQWKNTTCNGLNCNVTPTSTTTYTLSYKLNGQEQTGSLVVTVYKKPVFTLPANTTICSGSSITLSISQTSDNRAPSTIIRWKDDSGNTYTDGAQAANATSTGRIYTYTATVRNHLLCEEVSQSFTATVNIKPTDAAIRRIDASTKCQGVAFDLNSLVAFDVKDNYGNSAPGTVTGGSIAWYSSNPTLAASATLTPTGAKDTVFSADYNGVKIQYDNTCGSFTHEFAGKLPMTVGIPVSSSTFSLSDNMPCRNEPVMASYKLLDEKTGGLSTCDSIIIESIQITCHKDLHTYTTIRKTKAEWDIEFTPLTGIDDSITVKLVSESGVTAAYTHKLTPPAPPAPQGENIVCKGKDITFYIVSHRCDTIKNITFTGGLGTYTPVVTQMPEPDDNRYQVVIPKVLDDELTFGYKVDYGSNYLGAATYTTGTYTLRIHNETPTYSAYLDNAPFNAAPNLCLGDALNYSFYPGTCNTIGTVTFSVDGTPVQPTSTSPDEWKFTVRPDSEGTYLMSAAVHYYRPTEASYRTINILEDMAINVVGRPHIFMNNQNTDTTAFCESIEGVTQTDTINLKEANGKINYDYIVSGSAVFPDFEDTCKLRPNTGTYTVKVDYKDVCSEMLTDKTGYGVLRIIRDMGGISGSLPATLPVFCVTDGIYIDDEAAEGTTWEWTYKDAGNNDIPIPDFPYPIDPGVYTLTLTATNSCHSPGITEHRQAIVDPLPQVEAMPDDSVCVGTNVLLEVLPGHIGALEWNATSPVTITETTTFTATVSNTCGIMQDNVTIFRIPDAMVRTARDTGACYGDMIPLNVTAHEGTLTWYNIKWPDRPFTTSPPHVVIKENETFQVIAHNECGSVTASLNVMSIARPFVEVAGDSSICYGEPFLPQVHRVTGDQITWQPDPTQMPGIIEPVTFTVTAGQRLWPQCGSHSDTLNLAVYPPLELQPATLPPYKRLQDYELLFETLHAEPPVQYSFSGTLPAQMYFVPTGIRGTPAIGPNDYNTHEVNVAATDEHDCKVAVTYALKPEWSAATAFTPLENNANSIFLPGFQLEIYTRNGILIYKSNEETGGWDGTSNGRLVNAGTYFYKASAVFDGIVKQYTGYTTVMYR